MYAKGKQKPTVGLVLGSVEPCVLTLKPLVVDMLGVRKDSW